MHDGRHHSDHKGKMPIDTRIFTDDDCFQTIVTFVAYKAFQGVLKRFKARILLESPWNTLKKL